MTPKAAQAEVLTLIRAAVQGELEELERVYPSGRVQTIAWISRNLLELDMWTIFCIKSLKNVQTYVREVAKDSVHLLKLPSYFSNQPQASFDRLRAELIDKGKQHGIKDIEAGYSKVRRAAQDIGFEERFIHMNKIYSKFAHPTPFLLSCGAEARRRFCKTFYACGKGSGEEALLFIDQFLATGQMPAGLPIAKP